MTDPREFLLWAKHKCFEKGISPEEFRKMKMRDIKDIMEINNAIEQRKQREEKVRQMVGRMRR